MPDPAPDLAPVRSAVSPSPAAAPAPPPAPAPLYAAHQKIYPKAVQGRFRRLKWRLAAGLTALFVVLPWLRWDRGAGSPDQAVLFDLEAQRFYLFAVELWPQHIYFLTGAMILAAVGLFLATALAGRAWCGFTCPQTVWTDFFVLAEEWIEGGRGDRIRLDAGPRNGRWWVKKAAKHAVWLLISAVTGAAGLLYFVDAPSFAADFARGEASGLVLGWMAFIAACTYAMAGFMREQMCRYVCPWPRLQAAMLDEESLVVAYQAERGEGRGPLRKDRSWNARQLSGLGDCIDCGACVHVCPAGIDIRDGLQMDCISCGLCADACDDVMTRIGRPTGLIRFESQAAQNARAKGETPQRFRLARPRVIVYTLLLIIVGGATAWGALGRADAQLAVLRDRGGLYVTLSDGAIQNSYTVKIANMTGSAQTYRLSAAGPAGLALSASGAAATADGGLEVSVAARSVGTLRAHVRLPKAGAAASVPLSFTARAANGEILAAETVFLSP